MQFILEIQEWLNMCNTYKSIAICYQCRATKNDYMVAPSKVSSSFRHDQRSFFRECVRPGPKSISASWSFVFDIFVLMIPTNSLFCCFVWLIQLWSFGFEQNLGTVPHIPYLFDMATGKPKTENKVLFVICHHLNQAWWSGVPCMWSIWGWRFGRVAAHFGCYWIAILVFGLVRLTTTALHFPTNCFASGPKKGKYRTSFEIHDWGFWIFLFRGVAAFLIRVSLI